MMREHSRFWTADDLLLSLGFDLKASNALLAEAEQRRRQEDEERQRRIIEARRMRLDTKPAAADAPKSWPIKRTTLSRDEQDRRAAFESGREQHGLIRR